jgi:hypothetical protein
MHSELISVYFQDPVFYKLIVDKIKTEGGGFKALKKLREEDQVKVVIKPMTETSCRSG